MSRVRIVQMLCPERHCFIATAYESADGERIPEVEERLRQTVAALRDAGVMNLRCGICGAREFQYEDAATVFRTLREAAPALREEEQRMAATREFFRGAKN
jgi:hypothetical protein